VGQQDDEDGIEVSMERSPEEVKVIAESMAAVRTNSYVIC
jgi:hypothetical protein